MSLALPLAWLSALAMGATPALDALERARVGGAALDLAGPARALLDARGGAPALPDRERLEVWRLSAEVALTGEKTPEALDAIQHALAIDPRFAPAWPPNWDAVLVQARRLAPDRLPPDLSVIPPASAREGKPLALEVLAIDPGGVGAVTLVVHAPTGAVTIALQTTDGEHWRGAIPKALVKLPDVRWHVEATDRSGNGPSRWPASDVHVLAVVAADPGPPITARWWFWTAIGAVVVGGAIGLTVALTSDSGAAAPSSEGRVPVVILLP